MENDEMRACLFGMFTGNAKNMQWYEKNGKAMGSILGNIWKHSLDEPKVILKWSQSYP